MSKSANGEATFEEALAALEDIVKKLESGDLPLEQALGLFENGLGLARRCQEQLASVERRVEVLLKERGEIRVAPFDAAQMNLNKPESSRTKAVRPADQDDDIPF
jgi:exodeoxyribonuclease VII small subunit